MTVVSPVRRSLVRCATILLAGTVAVASAVRAQGTASTTDPRASLKAGYQDAGEAIRNLQLVAHRARPAGFFNAADPGDFSVINADLAFKGKYVFQGGYHGIQVWDVSNPAAPSVRMTYACPGGQGDVSVWNNLLFMSVEETSARLDCGAQGVKDTVSAERFRGVRIFDITDLDHWKVLAQVQTCRGSHTHTLLPDPKDKNTLYVYVSGTGAVRSPNELAGCDPQRPEQSSNTSLFRIDVIKVPLLSPKDAKIVSSPRVFADSGGAVAGLWKGGAHGAGTQTTEETNMCHDITVYPAIGLAAGACSGNGILLDIRDPANPKRVDQAMDPNFAYWHSATFNNDGSKVLFTDEWGGGVAPRCRASDKMTWGADALFTLKDKKLTRVGYYKLPVAQTETENCVAHNGSLIPVPGRDIMAQAWYQGGISVFDFTDAKKPVEIAYFDRGPVDAAKVVLAGYWSVYWNNGYLYGSEIARGLDVFQLVPSDMLTQNEIDAAKTVTFETNNPQDQQHISWPPTFSLARAYVDQIARSKGLAADKLASVTADLGAAEQASGAARKAALTKLATSLEPEVARSADPGKVLALSGTLKAIAGAIK